MTPIEPDSALADAVRFAERVVVFTGAGMSAESGVPTFRDALTGLWERFDPAELASPQAWERDPALVWAWYEWRAALVRRVEPNAGHRALAEWAGAVDRLNCRSSRCGRAATVVEINPEPTDLTAEVTHSWRSTAGQALPVLASSRQ